LGGGRPFCLYLGGLPPPLPGAGAGSESRVAIVMGDAVRRVFPCVRR
jgi:hypothetical protein